MKTMRWMVRKAAMAAVVLLAVGMLGQKGAQKTVSVRELEANDVAIGGLLGHPLGEYVTVEGVYFGPPAKRKSGLHVEKVDGQALKDPIVVPEVEILGGGVGGMGGAVFMSSLSEGVRYSLRGYESATFVGVPDDAESPPTPDQLKWRQSDETPKLHLVSKFVFAARGGIKTATASTQEGNK